MIIKPQHTICGPDLSPIIFITSKARSRYDGSSLLDLRRGGNDWYIYQPPIAGIDYEPGTQKLDGIKRIEGVYVTEGVINIPESELAQRAISKIDAELSAMDSKVSRGLEDLIFKLQPPDLPQVLSDNIARKEGLRAARAALSDGTVTEQEASDLGTTKTGFWTWLGGLFT